MIDTVSENENTCEIQMPFTIAVVVIRDAVCSKEGSERMNTQHTGTF